MKSKLMIVDDNAFVLDHWQRSAREVDLLLFQSPTEALEQLDAGAISLRDVTAVVSDLMFPNDIEDGGTFARKLRHLGYDGLIFAMSHMDDDDREGMDAFNGRLEKRAYQLSDILALSKQSDEDLT